VSQVYLVHSQADRIAATELVALAESQNVEFVSIDFDPEADTPQSYEWGLDVHRRVADCVAAVVLCSDTSMGSRWIAAEIAHVRAAGKAVFAVRLDECVLAPEVCEYDVIDVRRDRHNAWQQLWIALSVSGLGGPAAFDWDATRSPYPGLTGYDEDDAAVFFGRDADVRDALGRFYTMHRTSDARMMTLVGPPGAGKSSLVRAGLLPRLSRDSQRFIPLDTLRLDSDPFTGLAAAIAGVFKRYGEPMDQPSLADGLRAAATNPDARTAIRLTRRLAGQIGSRLRRVAGRLEATPLLFCPRLERLLVADDAIGRGFLGLMRILLDAPDRPLTVIATLDSDYVRDLQVHHAMRGLTNELVAIQPLSPSQLRTAMQGPADVAGVKLERGLTKRIFADAMTIGDPELRQASVAYALNTMWRQHGSQGFIGRSHYEALRPLPRVIGQAAEKALGVTPRNPRVAVAARRAVCGVVRFDRLRRAMPMVVAGKEVAGLGETAIEKMIERRLLVRHEDGHVEVPRALFASWPRAVKWLIEERRTRPSQGMPAAEVDVPTSRSSATIAAAEAPATSPSAAPVIAPAVTVSEPTQAPTASSTEAAAVVASTPAFAPVPGQAAEQEEALDDAAAPMVEGPTERDDISPEPTLWDAPEPSTPPPAPEEVPATPADLPPAPHREDARLTPPPQPIEELAPLSPAVAQWAPPPPPMAPSIPGLRLAAYQSSAVPPLAGRRGRAFAVALGMLAVVGAGGTYMWHTAGQGSKPAPKIATDTEHATTSDRATASTATAAATAATKFTAGEVTADEAQTLKPAPAPSAASPTAPPAAPTRVAAADSEAPTADESDAPDDTPPVPADAADPADQAGVVVRILAAQSPLTALQVLTSLDDKQHPRDGLRAALKLDMQALPLAEEEAAKGPLNVVRWDSTGKLVVAGDKQRVVVLDADANTTVARLDGEGFVDARIGPKATGLLTLHDDGKARWRPTFDAAPILVGDTRPPQPGRGWSHAAFSPDASAALVVARGTLTRLQLDGKKPPHEELIGSGKIRDVRTAGGRFVAISTSANVLKMWKWRDGRPSDRLIDRISFSNRKRRFLAATMTEGARMLVTADVGPSPGAPDTDRVAITVWHRNSKGYWWNLRARFLRQARVGTLKAQVALADDGSVAIADLVRVVRDANQPTKHLLWMFERADWRRYETSEHDIALDPSARFFVERRLDGKTVLRPRKGDGETLTGARITSQRFARNGKRLATAHIDGMVRVWNTSRRHHTMLGWQAAGQTAIAPPVAAPFTRDADGSVRIGAGPAAGAVLRDTPPDITTLTIHRSTPRAFTALADRVFVWKTDSRGAPMVAALPDCSETAVTRFSTDASHLVHRCGSRTKTLLVDWAAILAKLRAKAPGCLSAADRQGWLGEDAATAAKKHAACRNAPKGKSP